MKEPKHSTVAWLRPRRGALIKLEENRWNWIKRPGPGAVGDLGQGQVEDWWGRRRWLSGLGSRQVMATTSWPILSCQSPMQIASLWVSSANECTYKCERSHAELVVEPLDGLVHLHCILLTFAHCIICILLHCTVCILLHCIKCWYFSCCLFCLRAATIFRHVCL